jgi:autotransporter-associated beta strand protein
MKRLLVPFAAALSPAFILILGTQTTQADSATWKTSPATGDWNHAANWTPPTIPNGPADTATFASSNTRGVSISANTEVNGIVFNAGAAAFTISTSGPALTISGNGVVNNSGIEQHFAGQSAAGLIQFTNSATAGDATYTQTGNGGFGTITQFLDTSNAGAATFINQGGTDFLGGAGAVFFFESSTAADGMFFNLPGRANGGATDFFDDSNAGNATFICDGGSLSAPVQGFVSFYVNSSAANATFVANGEEASGLSVGLVTFEDNSTAANATVIANGGTAPGAGGGRISFFTGTSTAANANLIINGGKNGGGGGMLDFEADSDGGTARVQVFANGRVTLTNHNAPGISVGSIEGNGAVVLGANNLTVGGNHLNTNFSGVISGTGGSLTKIGTGKLVLRHRNTYTGGTTIKRGILMVNNIGASGTGSGPVAVNGGRLGGVGTIAGAVTVGSGGGREAVLSPGYQHSINPGTLTIQSSLTFNSDATYEFEVNSSSAIADEVIANGVTINNGAQFSFKDVRSGSLPIGTVFTVIDNTAATLIAGTFSNLPDGSAFTVNGNTYQVNYEGGDGNDLTLTVVP